MFKPTLYLLSLFYLVFSVPEDEFAIVSTTRRTSESLLNSESRQFTICTIDEKISSIRQRVETLESTNGQNKVDKRINEIEDRLKVAESKHEQNTVQQKLEIFASRIDQEINGIHNKLVVLESSVGEISQMLKIINSTLSQQTNHQNNTAYLKNCKEVKQPDSKIYQIKPDLSPKAFDVFCDMKQRGGGWTYILNRFDGSQNFNLTWNEYKVGFGSLSGEFWLGLDSIYYLTGNEINELLIELVDWNNTSTYAFYNAFSVGNETEGYPLKVLGKYEGTAGDSFSYNVKMKFATFDTGPHAKLYGGGGWWYDPGMWSALTGKYYTQGETYPEYYKGVYWYNYFGGTYSLKQARMMVKPRRIL